MKRSYFKIIIIFLFLSNLSQAQWRKVGWEGGASGPPFLHVGPVFLVGAGPGVVFRSEDAGNLWKPFSMDGIPDSLLLISNYSTSDEYFYDLINTKDSLVIYRMAPADTTWVKLSSKENDGRMFASLISLGDTIIIGGDNVKSTPTDSVGILFSSDRGKKWIRRGNGLPTNQVSGVFAKKHSQLLYFPTIRGGLDSVGRPIFYYPGIYLSDNFGETWYHISTDITYLSNLYSNDSIYWAWSNRAEVQSTDGGYHWETSPVIPDQGQLVIDSNRVFLISWYAIDESTDYGNNWRHFEMKEKDLLYGGFAYNKKLYFQNDRDILSTSDFQDFVTHNSGLLSADWTMNFSRDKNIFASHNKYYQFFIGNKPSSSYISEIIASSDDGETWRVIDTLRDLYLSENRWLYSGNFIYTFGFQRDTTIQETYTLTLLKSKDGINWISSNIDLLTSNFPTNSVFDVEGNILVVSGISGIFLSANEGSNWDRIFSDDNGQYLGLKIIDSSSILFIKTNGTGQPDYTYSLIRSNDIGKNWSTQAIPILTNKKIVGIEIVGNSLIAYGWEYDTVYPYTPTKGKIYKSSDYGITWSEVLSAPSQLFLPQSSYFDIDHVLFIANSRTAIANSPYPGDGPNNVWFSLDTGNTWEKIFGDLKSGNRVLATSQSIFFGKNGLYKLPKSSMSVRIADSKNILTSTFINVFPNPVFAGQKIIYSLAKNCGINLQLMDIKGRRILNFDHGFEYAGLYELKWDASSIPNGEYFLVLAANGEKVLYSIRIIH